MTYAIEIKSFALPVDGTYLVVASSFRQRSGGHYRLQLTCENDACALPGALSFSVSAAGVVGVDPDLVVRPFGWKGREAAICISEIADVGGNGPSGMEYLEIFAE